MNHFCIIIDSQRGYARLDRCLEAVTHAINTTDSPVDIIVLVDKVRSRYVMLAERHNAQLLERSAGTRGQRYNACAHHTQATTLVFIDPLVELPKGWLAWSERAMLERAWDAVALTVIGTSKLPWLTRLLYSTGDTLALSVKRQWFERVGGFDVEREQGIESDLLLRLVACHARVLNQTPEGNRAAG
ncbi:hypothetical protein ACPF7Z_18855 [Halomonas sp. GXIMD04776]|uniref:hypothetical protein n=1 Tax=Halomonas sp. GXIMD04776 TaxID=3415605 RepID=UPI003CAF96F7